MMVGPGGGLLASMRMDSDADGLGLPLSIGINDIGKDSEVARWSVESCNEL